jgi:hypothetical protein
LSEPVLYEVTLEVDPALAAAVERYMRETHIPEIWSTGCFRHIRFDHAGPTTFRTCYQAGSQADLDRYLRDHATAFRADVAAHFPTGLSVSRLVWSPLRYWP